MNKKEVGKLFTFVILNGVSVLDLQFCLFVIYAMPVHAVAFKNR